MVANNAAEDRQIRQINDGTNSARYKPRDGGEWPVNYMLVPVWRSLLDDSPQTAVPVGALSGRCAPLPLPERNLTVAEAFATLPHEGYNVEYLLDGEPLLLTGIAPHPDNAGEYLLYSPQYFNSVIASGSEKLRLYQAGTHRSTAERTGSISINSAQEVKTIVNVKKVMVKKGVTLSLGNFENQRLEVMMEAEIHPSEEWDEATAELSARVNSVLIAEAEPALSLLSDAHREDWLIRLGQLPTAQQISEGTFMSLEEITEASGFGTPDDDDSDDPIEHLRADDDGMPPVPVVSDSGESVSDNDAVAFRVAEGDVNETLQ